MQTQRAHDPRVYVVLAAAAVRSQMQYRSSFVLQTATNFLVVASDFLPLYFLMLRFELLRGWRLPELAMLYGMVHASWAIVELLFAGFGRFAELLLRGDLDRLLLRPRSVVLQIAAHELELRRIGRLLQGTLVLAVAGASLSLSPASWLWVIAGVAGGAAFFLGVVLAGAASQFITLGQTSELQNVLTYGGCTAMTYPVSIYAEWFRRVVTYGIPLAFISYFPALAALDRTASEGVSPFVPWLSPVVCVACLVGGHRLFRAGLSRYESTGS